MKKQDRIIYKDGADWVNKRVDAERATSRHSTQAEACNMARQNLGNQGGGELIIKGLDGKIRAKDTIKPGNDPRNIKG